MKNKLVKKLLAGTLALVMVGSVTGCGAANVLTTEVLAETTDESGNVTEDEMAEIIAQAVGTGTVEGVDKTETVYVFTDANGAEKSVTVSSRLANTEKQEAIEDTTSLKDVQSVEGDAVFSNDGEEYTWTTNGEDVVYQGTTDKEPPVGTKITYFLDGKEVSPEEIAGKKGSVKIKIEYTNNEKVGDVYVPFTAVTGMVFSGENVKNVTVDNGNVINEGKNTVVVGMGFPGLEESLKTVRNSTENDLRKLTSDSKLADRIQDINIPSSVEVTMDAEDFSMGLCMTMVFSNLLSGDDSELENDRQSAFDDLDRSVNELVDNGQKLADGATKLSDGIGTAYNSVPEFVNGVTALADGIKAYTDGVGSVNNGVIRLADGANSAKAGADELAAGVKTYTDGVSQVADGASKVAEGASSAAKGAGTLAEGVKTYTDGVGQLHEGAGALADGAAKTAEGAGSLAEGVKTYTAGVASADAGAKQVAEGASKAKAGADALASGISQYTNGASSVDAGAKQLKEGSSQVKSGADSLSEGIRQPL